MVATKRKLAVLQPSLNSSYEINAAQHVKRNGGPELTLSELMHLVTKPETTERDFIRIFNLSYHELRGMIDQLYTCLRGEVSQVQQEQPIVVNSEIVCKVGERPRYWMLDKNKYNHFHLRFVMAHMTAAYALFQPPADPVTLEEDNDAGTGKRAVLDTYHRQFMLLKLTKLAANKMKDQPLLREEFSAQFTSVNTPRRPSEAVGGSAGGIKSNKKRVSKPKTPAEAMELIASAERADSVQSLEGVGEKEEEVGSSVQAPVPVRRRIRSKDLTPGKQAIDILGYFEMDGDESENGSNESSGSVIHVAPRRSSR